MLKAVARAITSPGVARWVLVGFAVLTLASVPGALYRAERMKSWRDYGNGCASKCLDSKPSCELFTAQFKQFELSLNGVLYVRSLNGSSALTAQTSALFSNFDASFHNRSCYVSSLSYYTAPADSTTNYVSADHSVAVLVQRFNQDYSDFDQCIRDARQQGKQLQENTHDLDVVFTGFAAVAQDNSERSGIPWEAYVGSGTVAFAILLYALQSVRLLIIPLASLTMTMAIGQASVYLTTYAIELPKMIWPLGMFFLIAGCIDYNLFMLMRWQDERRVLGVEAAKEHDAQLRILHTTIVESGTVVMLAALMLGLGWLSFLGLPQEFFAVGAMMVPVQAITSLTLLLTPSLLWVFGDFFHDASITLCGGDDDGVGGPEARPLLDGKPPVKAYGCYYYVVGSITQGRMKVVVPTVVVVLLLAAMVPFFSIDVVFRTSLIVEEPYTVSDTYRHAIEQLPQSVVQDPYGVAVVAGSTAAMHSTAFFGQACALITELRGVEGVALKSIYSVAWDRATDTCVGYTPANAAKYPSLVNEASGSVVVQFGSTFDSVGRDAQGFVGRVRDAMTTVQSRMLANNTSPPEMQLTGILLPAIDFKVETWTRLPWVTALMLGLLSLSVGLAFRSVFVVVKMLFTIVLPMVAVFGLITLVYQHSALDWMGVSAFRDTNGVDWDMLVVCTPVLLCLAMDYDIFLFARVYEIRSTSEFDDREAVLQAVDKTGFVIGAAGGVMIASFLGFLFIDDTWSNQLGLALILGIALDTFVMRVVVVPCVLCLVPWLNYWPTVMPEAAELDALKSQEAGTRKADPGIVGGGSRYDSDGFAEPTDGAPAPAQGGGNYGPSDEGAALSPPLRKEDKEKDKNPCGACFCP